MTTTTEAPDTEAATTVNLRLIPVIVAVPLFLQNLDTSILGTALKSIAIDLHVEVLRLNLAVTAYLLSLALFLPMSGWLTDRFGTRRVFCSAVAIFSLASALCGTATSLSEIVMFRLLQGLGGAMMVPVGRLILLRSIPPAQLMIAMVWFTVPGAFGRVAGPLLGGIIVTLTSWRWIFLLNVPFGVAGILLSMKFIPDSRSDTGATKFDTPGFLLMALALGGLVCGLETMGRNMVSPGVTITLLVVGTVAGIGYVVYSQNRANALIPLRILKFKAFRAATVGAVPMRLVVGSAPIYVPLLFQVGLGFTPIQSGLMSGVLATGSWGVRAMIRKLIRRFGFKRLMMGANVVVACSFASYGLFRSTTPIFVMIGVLLVAGVANSCVMLTLNTIGYSGMEKSLMSRATALSTMIQQTSISFGVALCASLITATANIHGHRAGVLDVSDFGPTFFIIGGLSLLSIIAFHQLPDDEGSEMR